MLAKRQESISPSHVYRARLQNFSQSMSQEFRWITELHSNPRPLPLQSHAAVLCWAGLGGTEPWPPKWAFPGPLIAPTCFVHLLCSDSAESCQPRGSLTGRKKCCLWVLIFDLFLSKWLTLGIWSPWWRAPVLRANGLRQVGARTTDALRPSPGSRPYSYKHLLISTNKCLHPCFPPNSPLGCHLPSHFFSLGVRVPACACVRGGGGA